MYAQKLVKKARKASLVSNPVQGAPSDRPAEAAVAAELFRIAELCEAHGWSSENLLRAEARRRENGWRKAEASTKPLARKSSKA